MTAVAHYDCRERTQPVRDPDAGYASPHLLLLGTVELRNAHGVRPRDSIQKCLEYVTYLLEFPWSSAQKMESVLAISQATRRTNLSRLRRWLGVCPRDRQHYLPRGYSGSFGLHAEVSSDWEELQTLTNGDIAGCTTDELLEAFHLVRGAPLANIPHTRWRWADRLRVEMVATITELGIELGQRLLDSGDLERARHVVVKTMAVTRRTKQLLTLLLSIESARLNQGAVRAIKLELMRAARHLDRGECPHQMTPEITSPRDSKPSPP